jgi:GNAT superfamily N-acetyltransferase
MGFLLDKCTVLSHNDEMLKFSCGDKDLDDFFLHDAAKYERQLLGKTYLFRLDSDNSVIVCAFTLSNSSIDSRNLPNNRKRKLTENIPFEKSLSSYPATLLGRLGVDKEFSGQGIGTEMISFIKQWMLDPSNKTACRYLTVDAYNNEPTLKFYTANGFKTIFSSDNQEKEYVGLPKDKELKTRLMYFDLMLLKSERLV